MKRWDVWMVVLGSKKGTIHRYSFIKQSIKLDFLQDLSPPDPPPPVAPDPGLALQPTLSGDDFPTITADDTRSLPLRGI